MIDGFCKTCNTHINEFKLEKKVRAFYLKRVKHVGYYATCLKCGEQIYITKQTLINLLNRNVEFNERRKYARKPYNQDIYINRYFTPDGVEVALKSKIEGMTMDISMGGIGLFTLEQLERNSTVMVSVSLRNVNCNFYCKVTHINNLNNIYRVGLQFLNMDEVTYYALKYLLDSKENYSE